MTFEIVSYIWPSGYEVRTVLARCQRPSAAGRLLVQHIDLSKGHLTAHSAGETVTIERVDDDTADVCMGTYRTRIAIEPPRSAVGRRTVNRTPVTEPGKALLARLEARGTADNRPFGAHIVAVEDAARARGDMGLSTNEVGAVVQGLARCIVDREDGHDWKTVQAALLSPGFDETLFWEHTLGPAVDRLTEILFGDDDA